MASLLRRLKNFLAGPPPRTVTLERALPTPIPPVPIPAVAPAQSRLAEPAAPVEPPAPREPQVAREPSIFV